MGVFYALLGAFFAIFLTVGAFFAGYVGGKFAANTQMTPAKGEEDEEESRKQQKLQKQWDALFSYNGRKGGEEE